MRTFLIIISSLFGAAVVLTVVIWMLAFYGLIGWGDFPAPKEVTWQAVFLTNNQVYFGHLTNLDRSYLRLTNVYYLRVAENLQQGGGDQNQNLNLVKLGGELHGPEDAMFIPKDKVQFWENLSSTSRVVNAIKSSVK